MATVIHKTGGITWSGSRDEEGYRFYKVSFIIRGNSTDGPANVLRTPGLPRPGSLWLIDADVDLWAWCHWNAQMTPMVDKGPNRFWTVELDFSNKPVHRCNDTPIDNPLLQPAVLSGGFNKYQEEAVYDRFGVPITNSAWEQIRGPQVEFDKFRPTVKWSYNVGIFNLPRFSSMIDNVNDRPLWGLGPRTIKFSSFTWERRFYGQCFPYYNLNLEFDVRFEGWDRILLDEGNKMLNGHWHAFNGSFVLDRINGQLPNFRDKTHFIRAKDKNGENMHVILNGQGLPADAIIYDGEPPPSIGVTCVPGVVPLELPCILTVPTPTTNGCAGFQNYCVFTNTGSPPNVWTAVVPWNGVNHTWTLTCAGGGTDCSSFRLDGTGMSAFTVPSACTNNPLVLRYDSVILTTANGAACDGTLSFLFQGGIVGTPAGPAGQIFVSKYEEANLLLLGIPSTF